MLHLRNPSIAKALADKVSMLAHVGIVTTALMSTGLSSVGVAGIDGIVTCVSLCNMGAIPLMLAIWILTNLKLVALVTPVDASSYPKMR